MPYVAEEEVRRAVMDIRMSGFRPVIAHVERYDQLEMDPDILYDLREQGRPNSGQCIQSGRQSEAPHPAHDEGRAH